MRYLSTFILLATALTAAPLKDIAGREYPTVKVGEAHWMAENLDVEKFRNGDPILHAQSTEAWNKAFNEGIPAWCHYPVDGTGRTPPGRLYNIHVITDARGIAPAGWRIPTPEEFVQLSRDAGGHAALRSTEGWERDGNGDNATGFNAIPGGYRYEDEFFGLNFLVTWWTTAGKTNTASLHSEYKFLDRGTWDGAAGFYIRCIK